ncbi:hypothetical protein [Thermococcus sp.]|uniref:hypothetical protein n=1 Tax=Thermococcus sp. TaxID=35749 RepID=UPI0025EA0A9B|nr:hypothetical protein [Thermococcus sp.]
MEPFQVHAIVQVTALLLLLFGIYYARKHDRRVHHYFVYSAVGLLTAGVAYMLYTVVGVPSAHGRFGLFVYAYVLFAAASGRLFWGRKLTRNTHKMIALSAVLLLFLQILAALYLYVL